MDIFRKKSDAHEYLCEKINEKIESCEVAERVMISYARCTEMLDRVFPNASLYVPSSLDALIEPWGIVGWKSLSEYIGYPPRTLRDHLDKDKDFRVFCGQLVTCIGSADQQIIELYRGLRGNRPKKQ